MNTIKQHYEKYWQDREDAFTSYERNLVLPGFFQKGEHVLDLACGDGTVASFLQEKLNIKVIGVDISNTAIKQAGKNGVEAYVVDAEGNLPFKDNTFDVVFWGDNIEHLFDPFQTLKEIKRVLKSDGRLVLSCPNMGYWRYRLYYFLNGQLPDTEWTGLPPWAWSHIRFFNISILKLFLKEAGFKKITKVVGVSKRKIDQSLLNISPSLFGMITVIEASL